MTDGRVLHTGALLAIADGSIYMASVLRWADDNDITLAVPAAALTDAASKAADGLYRIQLALNVDVVHVVPLTEQAAIEIGVLCAVPSPAAGDVPSGQSVYIAAAQRWPIIAAEADVAALNTVEAPELVDIELVP